jgi:hypothetical protein
MVTLAEALATQQNNERMVFKIATITDGAFIEVQSDGTDNPSFFFNASDTVNPDDLTRPNFVVSCGHNLTPGGGAAVAGEGFFGDGWEGHFDSGGEQYWERHIYAAGSDDVQRRPFSIRINKDMADIQFLLRASAYKFFNQELASESFNPVLDMSDFSFVLRLAKDGSDNPTHGISLSSTDTAFSFTAQGGSANTKELTLASWATIALGDNVIVYNNGNISSAGTATGAGFTAHATDTGYVQLKTDGGGTNAGYVLHLDSGGNYLAVCGNSATDYPIDLRTGADLIVKANTTELFRVDNAGPITLMNGPTLRVGTGSPESAVTAPKGSEYWQTDATDGTSPRWLKCTGTGNTGWKLVTVA